MSWSRICFLCNCLLAMSYFLSQFHYYLSLSLFPIFFNNQVPPVIQPITKFPLLLPAGSSVVIELYILEAFPPVAGDAITWIPSGIVGTCNGSYASVTFTCLSPTNPSQVMVIVSHPAKEVKATFNISVLGESFGIV